MLLLRWVFSLFGSHQLVRYFNMTFKLQSFTFILCQNVFNVSYSVWSDCFFDVILVFTIKLFTWNIKKKSSDGNMRIIWTQSLFSMKIKCYPTIEDTIIWLHELLQLEKICRKFRICFQKDETTKIWGKKNTLFGKPFKTLKTGTPYYLLLKKAWQTGRFIISVLYFLSYNVTRVNWMHLFTIKKFHGFIFPAEFLLQLPSFMSKNLIVQRKIKVILLL